MAQHQNLAKRRTVLALLSHGYLRYSVASDAKLLETSRGLGTGSPAASRHRAPAARQRGRRKGTRANGQASAPKSLKNLILDVFLAADHGSDLKNRCSIGHF